MITATEVAEGKASPIAVCVDVIERAVYEEGRSNSSKASRWSGPERNKGIHPSRADMARYNREWKVFLLRSW